MSDDPSSRWNFGLIPVLGCFLILGGLAFLVSCGKTYLAQRSFVAHSGHAVGTVVDLVEHVTSTGLHSSRTMYSYSPVFTFTDGKGKVQRVTSAEQHIRSDSYRIGDSVPVLYNPDRSYEAQLDTFYKWWDEVARDGFFGTVFLALGIWLARNLRESRAR